MQKKKFFPFGVLIVLLVLCIVFSLELFGCAPISSAVGTVAGTGAPSTSGSASGSAASEADFPPPAVSQWELPIIVSLTGEDAGAGLAAAWGFDYGVKTVNETGGIRGVPVKITVWDVASSDEKMAGETATVASDALAVIGPAGAPLFEVGVPEVVAARTPMIGAATDAQIRESSHPFVISCIDAPEDAAVSGMLAWMKAERFEKLCIFYDPASMQRTEMAQKAATDAGKTVTDAFQLGNTAFDAVSVAEKAIASGADAYYLDLNAEDTLRVILQLRSLSGAAASKLKILCGPRVATPDALEAGGRDLVGVRVWTLLDPTKDAERRKTFDEAYEKNVNDPVWYDVAVDYYQTALLLKEAINALGLTGAPELRMEEREKLALYLYDSGLVVTDHGSFAIVSGLKQTEAKLYKVTDKGFQL